MKVMADRRFLLLDISIEDVIRLLDSTGCLRDFDMDGVSVKVPDDARVVGATIHMPEQIGDAKLRVAFESDSLDDRLKYHGLLWIFKPQFPWAA